MGNAQTPLETVFGQLGPNNNIFQGPSQPSSIVPPSALGISGNSVGIEGPYLGIGIDGLPFYGPSVSAIQPAPETNVVSLDSALNQAPTPSSAGLAPIIPNAPININSAQNQLANAVASSSSSSSSNVTVTQPNIISTLEASGIAPGLLLVGIIALAAIANRPSR